MATSFWWYPYDGDYDNTNSSSTGWIDSKNHFFLGEHYDNRIFYYLTSTGGWQHGGRKIKVTAATFQVWRNDGDSDVGSMKINRRGNSGVSCSTNVTADSGRKSLTCTTAFCNDIADYINAGNTYINIQLTGVDTKSESAYLRVCGYGNPSYDASYPPRFYITWDYETSEGTIDSNFMYNAPATLTITPNVTTDYHMVNWYINNETEPYYSETLSAGTTTSSCSYFGNTPSGTELDQSVYFADTETVSAKAVLTTYTAEGTSLGTRTYTFTLTKPSGGSLVKTNKTAYNYNDAITILVYPIYESYTQTAYFYIKENTLIKTIDLGSVSEEVGYVEQIYARINRDTYFTELSNTCPAYVILTTYDETGAVMGNSRADFILKDHTKTYQSAELSVDPIVLTSSIVVTNPITQQKDTIENILSSFKSHLLNKTRPIGSIYISSDSTNPSSLFGGTWEAYSPARTLLSTSTSSEINTVGGAFTHTLTESEMGQHRHGLYYTKAVVYAGSSQQEYGNATSGSTSTTSAVGGGQAHNNTQPYEICYIWKRTA